MQSVRYGETKKITDNVQIEEHTIPIKQEGKPNQETKAIHDFSTTQASEEPEDKISYNFSINDTIPAKQDEKYSHELSTPQITMQPPNKTLNKSFTYMLFALGALLLIVGLFLVTYTTVVTVNETFSMYGVTVTVPTQKQISPYQSIGVIALFGAMASIGYSLFAIKEQTQ